MQFWGSFMLNIGAQPHPQTLWLLHHPCKTVKKAYTLVRFDPFRKIFCTYLTVYSIQVSRFSRKDKRDVPVDCPAIVSAYNKGMGGTDVMDHALSLNRPAIRTKKWWFPLLKFMLQTSMHNAYILYKTKKAPDMDFSFFLQTVVKSNLSKIFLNKLYAVGISLLPQTIICLETICKISPGELFESTKNRCTFDCLLINLKCYNCFSVFSKI